MSGLLAPWRGGQGGPLHVVGASGAEGVALLLFLAGDLGIRGIVAHDFSVDQRAFARSYRKANTAWGRTKREALFKRLLRLPITLRLRADYLDGVGDAALVFASQNWFNYPSNLPALPEAIAAGVPLRGVVDLAMDLFPGVRLGVTGSNGKSTTAGLLAWMLRQALPEGARLLHGGNDRDAQVALADLEAASAEDRLVWEVSNRHLRDRTVPVDVAVLTNITRNHVEDHGTFDAYVAAKARLLQGVGTEGAVVINATDALSAPLIEELRGTVGVIWQVGRSPNRPEDGFVWLEGATLMARPPGGDTATAIGATDSLGLPGAHNRHNLAAAVAAALAGGARPEALEAAWASFAPLPGRLELVAERDGIRWVYDIQATTAPAAEAGIRAIGGCIVLIIGGEDKAMDYVGMADAARAHCRTVVMLPGTGSDAFLVAAGSDLPHERAVDLDEALRAARAVAEPGDTVLVSPGCAFFSSRFVAGKGFHQRVAALLGAQ